MSGTDDLDTLLARNRQWAGSLSDLRHLGLSMTSDAALSAYKDSHTTASTPQRAAG